MTVGRGSASVYANSAAAPAVSVVMPVYNAAQFVREAVESVFAQSLGDIELIVVDDASSDGSGQILSRFSDSRLRHLRNERNLGMAASLNRGIEVSTGRYVARLDADDACARDRLERQVAFLDRHPDIAILGTAARVVGDGAACGSIWKMAASPLAVRFVSLLRSPFLHPTVMARRAAFATGELVYDAELAPAEDYGLWARALRSMEGTNLKEPLVTYRLHAAQMTSTRRSGMLDAHDKIARDVISHELPNHQLERGDLVNMRRTFVGGEDGAIDRVSAVRSYLDLLDAFVAAHLGHPEIRAVKREAAIEAGRVLMSAGRHPALPGMWRRLIRTDPALPLIAIRRGSKIVGRRLSKTRIR